MSRSIVECNKCWTWMPSLRFASKSRVWLHSRVRICNCSWRLGMSFLSNCIDLYGIHRSTKFRPSSICSLSNVYVIQADPSLLSKKKKQHSLLFIIINNFPIGKWCAPVLDGRYNKSMRRDVGTENGVDGSARFDPVRKHNHGKWMFIRRIRVHHDGNVWFPCFAHIPSM
jgi:hypothetical protein